VSEDEGQGEESCEMMKEREKRKKRRRISLLYSLHASTCFDSTDAE
jgi:hypothetical protein